MANLQLTFASALYDRMQPIYTGEVKPDGIDLNFIRIEQPRPIFDRMSQVANRAERAMARAGLGLPSPKDLAPVTLFLCGPEASKITGQVISVNGGLNA